MCDLDYPRLVSMLFSGLITAVLVIAINEGLNFFKLRKKRRGILLLLICELIANESLIEMVSQKETTFRYTVWEKSCVEVADFLSQRTLAELSATYSLLRKIESGSNHQTNCQKAVLLLQRLQLELGRLAGVSLEKQSSQSLLKL